MGCRSTWLIVLLALFTVIQCDLQIEKEIKVALDTKDVANSPYYKDKVLSLPISNAAGKELMQHWTDQAFSGLISAIATRRLKLVEGYDKEKHEKCASEAHDVKSHAKCLVDLEKDGEKYRWLKRKKYFQQSKGPGGIRPIVGISETRTSKERVRKPSKLSSGSKSAEILKSYRKSKSAEKLRKLKSLESYEASKSAEKLKKKRRRILKVSPSSEHFDDSENWIGSFKTKRAKREIHVKTADSYRIKSNDDKTPFSLITRSLSNTVKMFKNKEKISKWQDVIQNIRDESVLMKKRKQVEKMQKQRMGVFQGAARIRAKDTMMKSAELKQRKRKKMDPTMRNFASYEKYIEDEELKEMFQKKRDNMTDEEKMMLMPMDLIRQATKLGLSLSGHNTTDFDGKTLKLISPRFMSLLPEDQEAKKQEVDIMSPSLFSLHDDGQDIEGKTSLKALLGNSMTSEDTQNLLDLLVEATGVSEAVEDAGRKMVDAQRKKDDAMGRGPDGQPLYFTKKNVTERFPEEAKKIEVFEELDRLYSEEQLKDMNTTGYTVLTPKQMDLVYGYGSPFKNPKLLKVYGNMTEGEIHRMIHRTIKDVAEEKVKFEVRKKDIVLSPIVNTAIINDPATASQALILSPAVMVPLIQSPAIFGTVVLSPWLFVPVILSPRILSPVILDPFMFVPIILSPLALVPVVLSPGIFNPFVLSPLLLSPFILSPQVMTPLILSPFALTPLILNPLALSPLVLSPFVLSPQVLSPQFVTGIILSPYALSPAIESNGKLVTVFASPSWLS